MHPATPASVASVYFTLRDTEREIDKALDQGNQRAFRMWCKRRESLKARLGNLLVMAVNG